MTVQPPGGARLTPPSPEDSKVREIANNLNHSIKETTDRLNELLSSPGRVDNETFLQELADSFKRLDELSKQAQQLGN